MEPLIVSELPDHPWYKVATDLFQWKGASYLIIVDYFSRYIEIARLANESVGEVVRHTKSIFARHGIPEIVVSDNGPQFTSSTFKDFANKYKFIHHTSSPYHPQGNGEAERAIRMIKSLLRKAEDPYLALLSYCATPVAGLGFSPAELLMSRMLRTTVPLCHSRLQPRVPNFSTVSSQDGQQKESQKKAFDRRHRAHPLKALQPIDPVWLPDREEKGHVVEKAGDRSYRIQCEDGASYHRNRQHIRPMPTPESPHQEDNNSADTGDDVQEMNAGIINGIPVKSSDVRRSMIK